MFKKHVNLSDVLLRNASRVDERVSYKAICSNFVTFLHCCQRCNRISILQSRKSCCSLVSKKCSPMELDWLTWWVTWTITKHHIAVYTIWRVDITCKRSDDVAVVVTKVLSRLPIFFCLFLIVFCLSRYIRIIDLC